MSIVAQVLSWGNGIVHVTRGNPKFTVAVNDMMHDPQWLKLISWSEAVPPLRLPTCGIGKGDSTREFPLDLYNVNIILNFIVTKVITDLKCKHVNIISRQKLSDFMKIWMF